VADTIGDISPGSGGGIVDWFVTLIVVLFLAWVTWRIVEILYGPLPLPF
jgi:hypothetical protein